MHAVSHFSVTRFQNTTCYSHLRLVISVCRCLDGQHHGAAVGCHGLSWTLPSQPDGTVRNCKPTFSLGSDGSPSLYSLRLPVLPPAGPCSWLHASKLCSVKPDLLIRRRSPFTSKQWQVRAAGQVMLERERLVTRKTDLCSTNSTSRIAFVTAMAALQVTLGAMTCVHAISHEEDHRNFKALRWPKSPLLASERARSKRMVWHAGSIGLLTLGAWRPSASKTLLPNIHAIP